MQNFDDIQNIQKNVSLYFDNALSQEDQDQLLKHVDTDPQCSQIFNQEKSAREFLKSKIRRTTVSDEILDRIKQQFKK